MRVLIKVGNYPHAMHCQWVSPVVMHSRTRMNVLKYLVGLFTLPLTPHQDRFRQTEHHKGMDGKILVRDTA